MTNEISNIGKVFAEKIGTKVGQSIHGIKGEEFYPIGMFDSGVGGLTTLSQMLKQMPAEDVVFLADTARVPYGGKPKDEIIKINIEILNYFVKIGVKMIVMACGTSSAIAYPVLKDKYDVSIVSLIEPGSDAAVLATRNGKIGLIATLGTVQSGAYQNTIKNHRPDVEVFASPCPLFVPLIEGGFIDTDETRKVAMEYLKPLMKEGIDTLILGCTHYPHLINILREITGPGVTFVDPSENAIFEARKILEHGGLLNPNSRKGKYSYVVTGSQMQFEEVGSRLFEKHISGVKLVNLVG